MFYENPACAFELLDVFLYDRAPRDVFESGRSHTAISYRLVGNSVFYTNEGTLTAGSGCIAYIPPRFDYRHKNENSEKVIILHLRSLGTVEKGIEVIDSALELEPLFRRLLATWEEGASTAYNRCMVLLYRIFEELQRKSEKKQPGIPPTIEKGVKLLRKNFRNSGLTIAELADSCYISEVYFRRVYDAHFRESPLQTILNLRFQYACRLLRSGYYSQKQVAELSGFSDVKYFRTAFKKRYGMTLKEYIANETEPPLP